MTRMKKWWGKKAECLDDTSPEEIEEYVSDKKNDKGQNNDGVKEVECLDDTSPDDMEEDLSDINDDKNEKNTSKKRLNT